MQDIRPTGKKRPPWRGASVPVSAVNVPLVAPPPPDMEPFARTPVKSPHLPPRRRWRIGRRERLLMAGLLVVAVVTGFLAAIIFLPTARVELSLRTAPLLVDETLKLRADGPGENVIPGTAFFREVQVTDASLTTGEEIIGQRTRDSVDIVNRTVEEQKIKEQSRLVTEDGTLFYIQGAVNLPPGPSRVTVTVEADQPGEGGNIEPQKLYFAALDEGVRPLLYAEGTKKLTGGSGERVPFVTEQDMASARESAGMVARRQVEEDIRGELPKGWKILDESWTMEVISFETPIAVGAREPSISYTARVMVRVMGYEEEALEERLRAALEARMEEEYMLFPGPLSFTTAVKDTNWEAGEAELSARVTHTTIPNIQLPTLRSKILGQSADEAKKYLEGLKGVQSASISTWPFWVNSIPRIEGRVKLDLQSEREP